MQIKRERIEIPHGPHLIFVAEQMGGGSRRFGPCEVCGKHCETTYLANAREAHRASFTELPGYFGHRACVVEAAKSDLRAATSAVA